MKVLKNGVLSKKCGLKLEEIKKRLQGIVYGTVLRPLSLPNITGVVKSTRMRGGVAQCRGGEKHKGTRRGKRLLGRSRQRWKNVIKCIKIVWNGLD